MKRLIATVLAMLLSACASIQLENPAVLSPFGDGTQWIVLQDMNFKVRLNNKSTAKIVVPRGFVTDLASTPREIWSLYPPFGKYLTASILHDYLYWQQVCTREQADKIIYQAMHDAGVAPATQTSFFVALDTFGKTAWEENKAEKAKHLIRIIPESELEYDFSEENFAKTNLAKMTWEDYRKILSARNASDPVISSDKQLSKVCASLGNEIEVDAGFVSWFIK